MCGRYAASADPDELVAEFEVVADETGGGVEADYNVAPTKLAPVVLQRVPRGIEGGQDPSPGPEPVRQLRQLVWGLVPSWAKDRSVGARMINARSETIFDKPAFKKAATSRRALVPADGWFEWQASPTAVDARGKPRKQPFFLSRRDGEPLAFAGIYEFWKDGSRAPDDPQAWLATFAVLTTAAENGLDRIHDRMPVVLEPDGWDAWLDPALRDPQQVCGLLAARPAGRFVAVPVSTAVNSARNNGPELVQPLAVDELVGVVDPVTGEVLGAGHS